ncbi:tRNA (guanine-N(7)-)-methyltransferase (tRNA(m7G46)-methyltransferase) [Paecilomyces lecythidis]
MTFPPSKRQRREEYRQAQTQATQKESTEIQMPKKRFYRQRAHANPFSDHKLDYPLSPAHMDWASHFPAFVDPDENKRNEGGFRQLVKDVEVVDIGCGFGGLLAGLAPVLPDTLIVGMEIRISVLEYVTGRIQVLRAQSEQAQKTSSSTTSSPAPAPAQASSSATSPSPATAAPQSPSASSTAITAPVPGGYQNVSALRTNTMKFLPNFFAREQLSKIFICFPDPHFKARKHKARIVSPALNAEYAYVLRPGGLLYTITDVEDYHNWILKHFEKSAPVEDAAAAEKQEASDEREGNSDTGVKELWERVSDEELKDDPCVRIMSEETEESKKVTRNKGNKYVAVFRRKANPEWPA